MRLEHFSLYYATRSEHGHYLTQTPFSTPVQNIRCGWGTNFHHVKVSVFLCFFVAVMALHHGDEEASGAAEAWGCYITVRSAIIKKTEKIGLFPKFGYSPPPTYLGLQKVKKMMLFLPFSMQGYFLFIKYEHIFWPFSFKILEKGTPSPHWEKVPNLSGFLLLFVEFLSHATQIKYF